MPGESTGKPYCYEYPRPAVTVDLAAFAMSGPDLRVLLIRRKKDPFAGRWALPGGFLDVDEPIEDAARRELREETGLDVTRPIAAIGAFGDPGRDPRGRTISLAHATIVGEAAGVAGADDAAEAAWHDPRDSCGLAFDHDVILDRALRWLIGEVLEGSGGLKLLPAEFGGAEVSGLFATLGILHRPADTWIAESLGTGRIVPVGPVADRYRAVPGRE